VSGPERQTRRYAFSVMLGLCLPFPAAAVQLSDALLPVDAPLTLPVSPVLEGLDTWRLHGLFRQSGGGGWALLSTDQTGVLSVEPGAVLQDGIHLEAIENSGVWLRRGQHRAYLQLGGAPQSIATTDSAMSLEPVTVAPSQTCQALMAGGVPIDELTALGVCPGEAN